MELWKTTAAEISNAYEKKSISPVELIESISQRIQSINPLLNAFVTLDLEHARELAGESERRWFEKKPLSVLDGIPIGVKDSILVKGMTATWGSRILADFVPVEDELTISRLRAMGVIILGKTNCPEFTLQGYTDNALWGPTFNPWNTDLTPGGSSGGAVAAVSAGLGPIALGTDGGGSIRRPASYTNLYGLKPSKGRVPRANGFPAILFDFETLGPIAKSMDDLILAMKHIAQPDPRDAASSTFAGESFHVPAVRSLRILYVPSFGSSPVDPEVAGIVSRAAIRLEDLGHIVEEGEAPFDFERLGALWSLIGQVGLAWLLESWPGWQAKVTSAIQEMALNGATKKGVEFYSALEAVRQFRRELSLFFLRFDLILTPSAAALPWPAREPYPPVIAGRSAGPRGHAVFTAFANLAGSPGINVPAGFSSDGLPIGFQMVAAPGQDGMLCAVAAQYEKAHGLTDRFPQLAAP
ncbi:MAG: amidase [Verrucomicrobia bacterium]|nr:amidase [Verrucomicrobiota bacterium]